MSLDDRLREAGAVVRDAAAVLAGAWSARIPPNISVEQVRAGEVIVVAGGPAAPNAYPNEVAGVKHPVFGNRKNWVLNEHRPFLGPALEANADKVAEIVALTVDDWAHDAGFAGTG